MRHLTASMKMKVSKKFLLYIAGIIVSSSSASSFGSSSTLGPAILHSFQNKSINIYGGENVLSLRGGSSVETESLSSPTQLNLSEQSTEGNSLDKVEVISTSNNAMGAKATSPGFLRRTFTKLPWHTLPDLLTYARCISIPALIIQFYLADGTNKNLISSTIFALASITDFLDGYLARRWDICSPFGAFLDPVADKLMVSTALILLSGKYGPVVAIPSTIILAREIAVSALREWMASRGKRDSVKVGFQGKCKAALTMVSLTIVLAAPDGWSVADLGIKVPLSFNSSLVMNVGLAMLYLSAFVTVTSGSVYFKAAAPALLGKEQTLN